MPAIFNNTFWNENGRQLIKPSLACLQQNSSNYKTLLLQLNEEIAYNETGIWLANTDTSHKKFKLFFNKAIEKQVELAITPEYSCPWSIITELLKEGKFPDTENLWIIGCNSIKPNELNNIIISHPEITWIYDDILVNSKIISDPNKFFDPVCYFLNTKSTAGQSKRVVIIQFKNYPFGGGDAIWERDNLILGKTFYVISNEFASTWLVTLICSDTLDNSINFNTIQNGFFVNNPLLLVHIQLNQKPFNDNYKDYRNQIFSRGDKDLKKEMICLNWARDVKYRDNNVLNTFNSYGGSAFYIKSSKLNVKDSRINDNHKLGLYYTSWKDRKAHIYFLNYDEYVFLVENTKPSQEDADPSQFNRSGPHILQIFKWNDTWEDVITKVCDGSTDLINEIEIDNGNLDSISKNPDYINVERIIELSSGDLIADENWHSVSNLKSCEIQNNELNNRILFNHDPNLDSKDKRRRKIVQYAILKNSIINKAGNLPDDFGDTRLEFDYTKVLPEKYLINLHSSTSRMATGIYIGTNTQKEALLIKDRIKTLFKENHQGKMVFVWYTTASGIKRVPEVIATPTIKENVSRTPNSFNQKGRI